MRVFITGGTGFIGKPIVDRLTKQGHLVLLLSRSNKIHDTDSIRVIKGDLNHIPQWQNKLKKFKPDAAIHLAWEGLPDHSLSLSRANLEYGLNLTQLLAESGCKTMITTGSCWEYGGQSGKKLSEGACPNPFDPFTAAKHSLRLFGEEIAKNYDMNYIWTRLFYVYGPGQFHQSLIPHIINSVKKGQIPEIRNPEGQNDFIFVDDVAEAICAVLKKPSKTNLYNIGSGKLTSISSIVDHVLGIYGIKNSYKKIKPNSKDKFTHFYADISKIKKEVGWKPTTAMEEGIRRTINIEK